MKKNNIATFLKKGNGSLLYGISIIIAACFLLILFTQNYSLFNTSRKAQMKSDIIADGCAEYGRNDIGTSISKSKVIEMKNNLSKLNNSLYLSNTNDEEMEVLVDDGQVKVSITTKVTNLFDGKQKIIKKKAVTKLKTADYNPFTDDKLFPKDNGKPAIGYINYLRYEDYTPSSANYKQIIEQADIEHLGRYNLDSGKGWLGSSVTYLWDILNFMGVETKDLDITNPIRLEDAVFTFKNDSNWSLVPVSSLPGYAEKGYLSIIIRDYDEVIVIKDSSTCVKFCSPSMDGCNDMNYSFKPEAYNSEHYTAFVYKAN